MYYQDMKNEYKINFMFSKQSGNSELFSGLYFFLVGIFWRVSITFGRGKKYLHRRNCDQILIGSVNLAQINLG